MTTVLATIEWVWSKVTNCSLVSKVSSSIFRKILAENFETEETCNLIPIFVFDLSNLIIPSYIPKSSSSLKSPIQLEVVSSKAFKAFFKSSSEVVSATEVHKILLFLKVWSNSSKTNLKAITRDDGIVAILCLK